MHSAPVLSKIASIVILPLYVLNVHLHLFPTQIAMHANNVICNFMIVNSVIIALSAWNALEGNLSLEDVPLLLGVWKYNRFICKLERKIYVFNVMASSLN